LVGKHERKRPRGRHRRVWEDNIKMNLQDIRCRGGGGAGCVCSNMCIQNCNLTYLVSFTFFMCQSASDS
jgi:hypothetical protein